MIYDSVCAQARALSGRSLAAPLAPAAWRAGLAARRRRWLAMLGLDPLPPRTPLKVRITGRLERGDYTVDTLFFQSLPGVCVPGNLYRPARAAGRSASIHGPSWP